MLKAISPLDIQALSDGFHFVSRVEIAIAKLIVSRSVVAFSFWRWARSFSQYNPFAEIVSASTSTVDNFAKQSLSDHVQICHFAAEIALIFQKHARHTGLFLGIDQFLAVVNGRGRSDFGSYIFAGFHSGDGHGNMELPGGSDYHAVQIVSFQ